MKMINVYTTIDSRTLEETSPASTAAFPYRTDIADLGIEPGYSYPWHWHGEVELFYMHVGGAAYCLPGKEVVFAQGDIGFVNTNVPHMTKAVGDLPSLAVEHIFQPRLVGGQAGDAIEEEGDFRVEALLPRLKGSHAETHQTLLDDGDGEL